MKVSRITILITWLLLAATAARAQDTLFPYPVAPDTCTTLESRCNYSVQHFWDQCDFSKPFASDSLLLEAMDTYFNIMGAGANFNLSLASTRDMLFKSQAVRSNYLKALQAAELLLFANPTRLRDDLYLTFAQSGAANTGLNKELREHFKGQVSRISASKLGEKIQDFTFTTTTGSKQRLSQVTDTTAVSYLLLITDQSNNSSIERMRLDADVTLNQLIDSGGLKIINIVTRDAVKTWDDQSLDLSAKWVVGANKDLFTQVDVRFMPCIILLDSDLRVVNKNLSVDDIKNAF